MYTADGFGGGSDNQGFEAGGPEIPGQADMNVQPSGGLEQIMMQRAPGVPAGLKKKKPFFNRMTGMGGGMAGLGLAKKLGGGLGAGLGAAGALLGTKMGKAGVGPGMGAAMGMGVPSSGGMKPGMGLLKPMGNDGQMGSALGGLGMGGGVKQDWDGAMQGYKVGEMDPTAGFNLYREMGGGAQTGFDGGNGMSPEMKAKILEQLGGAGNQWLQAKKKPMGSDVQQMKINQTEADRLVQVPQTMGEVPVSQWRS